MTVLTIALVGARLRRAIIAQQSCAPTGPYTPPGRACDLFLVVRTDSPRAPPRQLNRTAPRGNLALASGPARDNLNRAKRLGLIQSADDWPALRLAHSRGRGECSGRPDAMLPALKRARGFVDTLCATCDANGLHPQALLDVLQSR
ncbi:hypothetical protein [Immundisolibacter sp.]